MKKLLVGILVLLVSTSAGAYKGSEIGRSFEMKSSHLALWKKDFPDCEVLEIMLLPRKGRESYTSIRIYAKNTPSCNKKVHLPIVKRASKAFW